MSDPADPTKKEEDTEEVEEEPKLSGTTLTSFP